MIEALQVWAAVGIGPAQAPLAHSPSGVAVLLQDLSQRDLLCGQRPLALWLLRPPTTELLIVADVGMSGVLTS